MSNLVFRPRSSIKEALKRFWPASAALLFLVVAASLGQFARAPRDYVASQQLQVVAFSSANGATSTAAEAAAIAGALADPAVLSTPRMAGDVLVSLPVNLQANASVTALQGAFTGSASGATLALRATWTSPQGADDLLGAALTALQTDATLLPSTFATDTVRVQPLAPASSAAQSSLQAQQLVQTLLQRILMGLLAAALLPLVLDAVLGWHVPPQSKSAAQSGG